VVVPKRSNESGRFAARNQILSDPRRRIFVVGD
jgi:hypothetical protein